MKTSQANIKDNDGKIEFLELLFTFALAVVGLYGALELVTWLIQQPMLLALVR
jgi:hypothetical protein